MNSERRDALRHLLQSLLRLEHVEGTRHLDALLWWHFEPTTRELCESQARNRFVTTALTPDQQYQRVLGYAKMRSPHYTSNTNIALGTLDFDAVTLFELKYRVAARRWVCHLHYAEARATASCEAINPSVAILAAQLTIQLTREEK